MDIKLHCLILLAKELSRGQLRQVEPEIKRMAETPTEEEVGFGTDETAQELGTFGSRELM
jgi:hypothetical protein